jgi:hypothetical protein
VRGGGGVVLSLAPLPLPDWLRFTYVGGRPVRRLKQQICEGVDMASPTAQVECETAQIPGLGQTSPAGCTYFPGEPAVSILESAHIG